MNTEKIIKEARIIMLTCLITGLLLLVLGIGFSAMGVSFIQNKKAIIGLSFIPLSVALIYYLKISSIKKTPDKMKSIIINENDERIAALKNEAAAKAFKIVQGAIFISYFGYTLMFPDDIFESVSWWVLMALLLIAFIPHGLLLAAALKSTEPKDLED
jgi:uncharacterized membrane protein